MLHDIMLDKFTKLKLMAGIFWHFSQTVTNL